LNSWDVQSKHIQHEDGKAEALYSGECRYGGGESYVMQEKVYCLQGNGIDRADTAGCNGRGWREDQSYTLNTIDRPAVLSVDEKMGQTYIGEEVGNTLGARDYKQPQAVCIGNGQLNQISMSEQANTLDTMHDHQSVLCLKQGVST
jgi:DNA (cytosine-5)-methyltransferase 1